MIITRTFTAVLAIVALAAPAAQAQQDLRSPDARDAAGPVAALEQDLRSPDSRDAASPVAAPRQDLRSPDTRDADPGFVHPRGARTIGPIPPTSEPVTPTATAGDDGGTDWGTIGLGLVASMLVVGGLAVLVGRRSRRVQRVGSTA